MLVYYVKLRAHIFATYDGKRLLGIHMNDVLVDVDVEAFRFIVVKFVCHIQKLISAVKLLSLFCCKAKQLKFAAAHLFDKWLQLYEDDDDDDGDGGGGGNSMKATGGYF